MLFNLLSKYDFVPTAYTGVNQSHHRFLSSDTGRFWRNQSKFLCNCTQYEVSRVEEEVFWESFSVFEAKRTNFLRRFSEFSVSSRKNFEHFHYMAFQLKHCFFNVTQPAMEYVKSLALLITLWVEQHSLLLVINRYTV